MRELLLGYLLGALDPAEHAAVEARLAEDAQLRRELELVRQGLAPLAADDGPLETPAGLAERTCRFVHERSRDLAHAGDRVAGGTWRWQDALVAAGVLVAATLLLFPAVGESRHFAQVTACKENLRLIGFAVSQYSDHNGGYMPDVPLEGNWAVAGIYAPTLIDSGHISDAGHFLCPGSNLARDPEFRIPSRRELTGATIAQLTRLQRYVGGSFGYTLGHMVDGRYVGTRNRHRTTFALLSDSPSLHLAGHQSANHNGRGQNVLFEDGHVHYLTNCRGGGRLDNLFLNEDGYIAPGNHVDDAVIAPGSLRPVN